MNVPISRSTTIYQQEDHWYVCVCVCDVCPNGFVVIFAADQRRRREGQIRPQAHTHQSVSPSIHPSSSQPSSVMQLSESAPSQ
mmetsp:Transcript_31040/g.76955  ORF Transcript_31040/g.76955 Transcript_31040/m.76955 type:complete len:83 (-) Transcript_31040:37-285(-)